jgi:hypothetical protein
MNIYGSGGVAPRVLNLGTTWKQFLVALPRGKFFHTHWIESYMGVRTGVDIVETRDVSSFSSVCVFMSICDLVLAPKPLDAYFYFDMGNFHQKFFGQFSSLI